MTITPAVRTWAKTAIVAGFAASVVYPLMITGFLPDHATVVLACSFGPVFLIALYATHRVLIAHHDGVAAQLVPRFAVGAATLITAMLTVQMATQHAWNEAKAVASSDADRAAIGTFGRLVWSVNLGLDVAWDVFIGLATLAAATAMYRHPWYGRALSVSGIAAAALLLVLNLATFPTPPANANLFDAGPFVGAWYLAVTIVLLVRYQRSTA